MWSCAGCNKPVYFAEHRESAGKHWHSSCMKCFECSKVLSRGNHADHKGSPYCHVPCYAALFGPRLFGHGSSVGSHSNFGQFKVEKDNINSADESIRSRVKSSVRHSDDEQRLLIRRITSYNDYCYNKKNWIKEFSLNKLVLNYRIVNNRLVFEGVLRVRLMIDKQDNLHNKPSVENFDGTSSKKLRLDVPPVDEEIPRGRRLKRNSKRRRGADKTDGSKKRRSSKAPMGVVNAAAANPKTPRIVRRRSSIRGHWMNRDHSVYRPDSQSTFSVHVTSLLTTRQVVEMVLKKCRMHRNSPSNRNDSDDDLSNFALFISLETGERRLLREDEYPLRVRVDWGPRDDLAQLCLMERRRTKQVSNQVASYLRFSFSECHNLLNKIYDEEESEVEKVSELFEMRKALIMRCQEEMMKGR